MPYPVGRSNAVPPFKSRAFRAGFSLALLMAAVATPLSAFAALSSTDYAQRIFRRIAGVPLLPADPRLAQMAALIEQGNLAGAAAVATDDDGFYDVTLRNFAAVMSNRLETPMVELDDFQATVVGAVRDDLDARTLLSGDFLYVGNDTNLPPYSLTDNQHYEQIDSEHAKLKGLLIKQSPQVPNRANSAGLLTTHAWAQAHYVAGTNRRAVEFTFQEFLCAPITQWRDSSLPDYHIRRDVDRDPSGDPSNFQNKCRGCHAPMDAMGGAFARFDFDPNNGFIYTGTSAVASKMNKNNTVYPDGYVTLDDSWINLIPQSQGQSFGWRGPTQGTGIASFGTMVAHSQAFTSCMVSRVFKQVCKRTPDPTADFAVLASLGKNFESEGYLLKKLFQETAASSSCLADAAASPGVRQ